MNAVNVLPAVVEVAKLGLRLDNHGRGVSPSVGRVALTELDRRRSMPVATPGAGLTFYLMAPLESGDDDIPDNAIELIKRTLGSAFRRPGAAVETLKSLWSAPTTRSEHPWALVEVLGNQLAVRPARSAFSKEFLTRAFDRWEHDVGAASAAGAVRILVEYTPSALATAEEDWQQLVDRLVDYAPAVEPAGSADSSAAPSPKEVLLAHHTLTAEAAVRQMGARAEDAATWASRKRRAGELFGVWSSKDRAFVHPDFQFGGVASDAQRKELFQVLRTRVGFDPAKEDKGGWARAYWLYQPHADLSERALAARTMDRSDPVTAALTLNFVDDMPRSPAEAFRVDPVAVIAAAKALMAREGIRD